VCVVGGLRLGGLGLARNRPKGKSACEVERATARATTGATLVGTNDKYTIEGDRARRMKTRGNKLVLLACCLDAVGLMAADQLDNTTARYTVSRIGSLGGPWINNGGSRRGVGGKTMAVTETRQGLENEKLFHFPGP